MSKAAATAFSTAAIFSGVKPRDVRLSWLTAGRALERAVADRIFDDALDGVLGIAETPERLRHHAVDDLEIAAAGELLEFDQREIGLDAGGVAVHHQADRAGRRDHRGLRIAVAVRLAAELERRSQARTACASSRGSGHEAWSSGTGAVARPS